jgi:molecular chaperone HscB
MVNYFELYGLSPAFATDATVVKKKYYELSRLYHPDRFAQAGDHERAEALRMAALNNDAYKTLSSADATMAYILKLHELLEDEEKYSLPPAFLMEMMDLNEAISEYEMEPENDTLRNQAISNIDEQTTQWQEEVTPLTTQYDAGNHSNELLLKIKDYYFRKKYLLRIQQRINTFASR